MGGKHKQQSQRTKHNAKPSSSGRSAELLRNTMLCFESAHSSKETYLSVPPLPTNENDITNMNANFQLIFKKMTKKDSTTKLKALQEFADLVKVSDSNDVKLVLPCWSRSYCILVTDANHHVREAAHVAHRQVVLNVKRELAPYLKQLMGPWFTSQYDTYPPAATAATLAFHDAFPASKFQEVLVYCQDEILTYILENLTLQTPQTINSGKKMSPEDAEAKYERILISSLQGYSLYLTHVIKEHIQNASELNAKIVSSNKFWILSKHKVVPVRAAWFATLVTICQKALFLLEKQETRVCSTVFTNLSEKEPTVLVYVWEAILVIITSVEKWWNYVNVEKAMLPKFWEFLKEGCRGNASVIAPNILPFISKLPLETDIDVFYKRFFENLKLGLQQKNVLASKSESKALVSSFVECVKYLVRTHYENSLFCEDIIKSHLVPLIECFLNDNRTVFKIVFDQIAILMQYWNCHRTSYNYDKYLTVFSDGIFELFKRTICQEHENKASDISSKQVSFIHSLKKKVKKSLKGVTVNVSGAIDSIITSPTETDDTFNDLGMKLCNLYVKLTSEKKTRDLLESILSLMQIFDSESLFWYLNKQDCTSTESSNLLFLYDNIFSQWLNDSDLCSKPVIDIIFCFLKYLDVDQRSKILDSLEKVITDEECFGWCIKDSLLDPYNRDSVVQSWLLKERVTSHLALAFEKKLSNECSLETSELVKLALKVNETGGLLVSTNVIKGVINTLRNNINSEIDQFCLDSCAHLVSDIAAIIYTNNQLLTCGEDVVLILFYFSCKYEIVSRLSEDSVEEVNFTWQNVLTALVKNLLKEDLNKIITELAIRTETDILKYDKNINLIINALTRFMRAVYQTVPWEVNDIFKLFFDRKFVSTNKNEITTLCNSAEYVRGNLCCLYNNMFESCSLDIDQDDICKYFVWSKVKAEVFCNKLIDISQKDDDESSERGSEADTEADASSDKIILDLICDPVCLVLDLLYDLAVASSFTNNFRSTKCYYIVENHRKVLEEKLFTLIDIKKELSAELCGAIENTLEKQSWMWCKAVYLLHSKISANTLSKVYASLCEKLQHNPLSILHITQQFKDHISYNNFSLKCNSMENAVVLRCLHCKIMNPQISQVLSEMEYVQSGDFTHFSNQSTEEKWKKMQEVIEVFHLLANLFGNVPKDLERKYWDFALISLELWSNKILEIKDECYKIEVQALFVAVCNLFICIEEYVSYLKEEDENNNYVCEWNDLFAITIYNNMLQLWLHLTENLGSQLHNLPFLGEFTPVVNKFNHSFIFTNTNNALPKWSVIQEHCFKLLKNTNTILQLCGYKMLLLLVPGLIDIDSTAVSTNTPHKYGLTFKQYEPILTETQEIVNSMLLDFKLGEDTCKVEEFTDSFTYTLAYLLSWDVLLTFCEKSSTELSYQYSDWLKESGLLKNALNNLFRLMPEEIVHSVEGKQKFYTDMFLKKVNLDVEGPSTSKEVECMVCWIYSKALTHLPVLVRQWWTELELNGAQFVEKITSTYVSHHLCNQELSVVSQYEPTFKNMLVKVVPNLREVLAIYTVDEAQFELSVTLPSNYPLGGPEVQCNKQIAGPSNKQWLMQLKKCLLHQNGRILDGLILWNKNLSKKFEGVEECYICFGVLHAGTYQLPKLSCHTCKKKFHSACLYKWFSTSNKSSCPICRNLF